MHPVSLAEIERLVADHGLAMVRVHHQPDLEGRPNLQFAVDDLNVLQSGRRQEWCRSPSAWRRLPATAVQIGFNIDLERQRQRALVAQYPHGCLWKKIAVEGAELP